MHLSIDPFDLASLFALRDLIAGLRTEQTPSLKTLTRAPDARSVALLPGSFNPPTAAHVLLAERALSEGYEAAVFVAAVSTVGKPPSGLILEDRLLAMRASGGQRIITAACSHGLYADQAEAAARAFPNAEITFLVGSDKVLQIFEDHWYVDREAMLERLFSRARLVAAPRGSQGEQIHAVLADARNRRWADRINVMRLHPAVGDLSSTRVRGLLAAGADPAGLVPAAVSPLLAEIKAFAPATVIGNEEVDAYRLRASLVERLCELRHRLQGSVDVRHLMRVALSATEAGRRFRASLSNGRTHVDDVVQAQRAVGV